MKHFAKLMLLTLGLVVVVAVVLSFLPRHTAAAAKSVSPPPNLNLVYGNHPAQCPAGFVAVLPTGVLSPSSGCYEVPEGYYLIVTDVTVQSGCITPPYINDLYIELPAAESTVATYARTAPIDTLGYASWHDSFATGLVYASTPIFNQNCIAGPPGVAVINLLGYLTPA